jgi:hypothetical protein
MGGANGMYYDPVMMDDSTIYELLGGISQYNSNSEYRSRASEMLELLEYDDVYGTVRSQVMDLLNEVTNSAFQKQDFPANSEAVDFALALALQREEQPLPKLDVIPLVTMLDVTPLVSSLEQFDEIVKRNSTGDGNADVDVHVFDPFVDANLPNIQHFLEGKFPTLLQENCFNIFRETVDQKADLDQALQALSTDPKIKAMACDLFCKAVVLMKEFGEKNDMEILARLVSECIENGQSVCPQGYRNRILYHILRILNDHRLSAY